MFLELWPHREGTGPTKLQFTHPPIPAQAKAMVLILSQMNCLKLLAAEPKAKMVAG